MPFEAEDGKPWIWQRAGQTASLRHPPSPEELHEICLYHVDEIKLFAEKLVQWAKEHDGAH